jgi:hypothetical protein
MSGTGVWKEYILRFAYKLKAWASGWQHQEGKRNCIGCGMTLSWRAAAHRLGEFDACAARPFRHVTIANRQRADIATTRPD